MESAKAYFRNAFFENRRYDLSRVGRYKLDRKLGCLLYTSDAADERSSVDLGGRRIIKKKTHLDTSTLYYV